MTKEELEKEAEALFDFPLNYNAIDAARHSGFIKGYLASAEPREKHIERLSKEIDDLENMKANLESRIAELEAQSIN